MKIILNGKPYELEQAISIQALIDRLELSKKRVAVEHNREVLKKDVFAKTLLQEGDCLEIVQFVGGG